MNNQEQMIVIDTYLIEKDITEFGNIFLSLYAIKSTYFLLYFLAHLMF